MSFEHSEFLIWMGIPLSLLFYLWITQKPMMAHPFSPTVFEKLRVKESSLGLKGRNILFFIAAWLIIIALCEPIAFGERLESAPSTRVIVVDISSSKHFEEMQKNVIHEIRAAQGEVELLALDKHLYRIAPPTLNRQLVMDLVLGLRPQQKVGSYSIEPLTHISNEYVLFSGLMRSIHNPNENKAYYEKIPLFYYPLGLSMILIVLALSSMSKRESVSMAWMLLLFFPLKNLDAGVMDFQILDRAYEAYERSEYDQSAQCFADYQRLHDSPEIRYNRANALLRGGHYKQARFWLERSYPRDPKLAKMVQWNLSRLPKESSAPTRQNFQKKGKKEEVRKEIKRVSFSGKTPLFRY